MRKPTASGKVLNQPKRHADAGHGKSPVPASFGMKSHAPELPFEPCALRQKTADNWGEERAQIDAHIKNRKAGVAARVVFAVEAADHRADVRLQQACAENEQD